jgi:hypothetical protein
LAHTKKLAKRAGGSSKDTSAAIPSITKRNTPQGQKLVGKRLLLDNTHLVIPAEAMWSTEHGAKRAWGTNILRQPGGNGQQNMGHPTPMEIAVKCATWKLLLNNMYLDSATRDLKGEDEAYTFASWNALGGLLVFARFFDTEKKAFTKDPCFMVIALPLTGLDGTALTLTSDESGANTNSCTLPASLSPTRETIHSTPHAAQSEANAF